MQNDELLCTVAINNIFCYRPKLSNTILEEFGSFSPLFRMSYSELVERFGKNYDFLSKISNGKNLEYAEEEIAWAKNEGIKIIPISSEDYPSKLKGCSDPPILLYLLGNAPLNNNLLISIVGTRMPTKYGSECCKNIIQTMKEIGLKPVIVSGLAYGIDAVAHTAALNASLSTIAILPGGMEKIYPASHKNLAEKIINNGSLITEFPRNSQFHKVNFVQRNRIIAGLSEATIIIESRERGGALITAELAHSYSREVFALPGRIGDICSQGCNTLISKNIASIFTSTEDFVKSMGWELKRSHQPVQKKLFYYDDPNKEKIILALNNESGLTKDEIMAKCHINLPLLSSLLLDMELEGSVLALPGERYSIITHR
ncbi:MAG TPA: DNA-protecting protein DprA [Rikenellaceae bacterium]|nr:DNA-protecting protein DprA [Rikenellaceae bacterium]